VLELSVRDGENVVLLQFEHSLVSVSKWEQKNKKPFSRAAQKEPIELIDYFSDMLLTPGVDPNIVLRLNPEQMVELVDYINDIPTATTFPPERSRGNTAEMTNERIYAQMIMLKIPALPFETWHLNRLMTLIREIARMHEPPKKRAEADVMSEWMLENEQRLEKYKTTG